MQILFFLYGFMMAVAVLKSLEVDQAKHETSFLSFCLGIATVGSLAIALFYTLSAAGVPLPK